ncbi:hypothetical protein ACFFRR_004494 [Megaselia abdita]
MKQKQLNLKKLIDQIATGDAAGGGSNAEHYMRDHVIYGTTNGEFYNHFQIQTDDYPEGYQRCTTMYSSNYNSPAALMHEGGTNSTSYQKEDSSSFVNNCYNDSIHHHLLQLQHTHPHPTHLVNYSNGPLPVSMQPQHSQSHSHSQIIPSSNLCQYNGGSNTKPANDDVDVHHQHHNLSLSLSLALPVPMSNHHLHNDDNRSRKSIINRDNDENDQMDETKLRVDHHQHQSNDEDNIVGDNDNSNGGQLFVIKKESSN